MTVLLPACGFGKRNPKEPVKELMIREGKPLIEFTFGHLLEPLASSLVKKIVIITREAKRESLEAWLGGFRRTYVAATCRATSCRATNYHRTIHSSAVPVATSSDAPTANAAISILVQEPGPGEEWPMTLLESQDYWGDQNLVLLPDTRVEVRLCKTITYRIYELNSLDVFHNSSHRETFVA